MPVAECDLAEVATGVIEPAIKDRCAWLGLS